MKFISKTVGRCLTQYKLENYDEIIGNYEQFVVISQFLTPPNTLDEAIEICNGSSWRCRILEQPKSSTGEILFGVEKDGSLTKLFSIIDSSD